MVVYVATKYFVFGGSLRLVSWWTSNKIKGHSWHSWVSKFLIRLKYWSNFYNNSPIVDNPSNLRIYKIEEIKFKYHEANKNEEWSTYFNSTDTNLSSAFLFKSTIRQYA